MTVSNLPRPVPAVPAGARFVNAQQDITGLLAAPFVIGTQATITTLSIVAPRSDVGGRMTAAIFAAGPNGRPAGAALGSATISVRGDGVSAGSLATPIDPPAGTYFAVVANQPSTITGAPIVQSIARGDFAVADLIGSTNPAAPCSGLALPFVGITSIDVTSATLTGDEGWQEITDDDGAPVVWLS